MPGVSQIIFVATSLKEEEAKDKRVIDVGSRDYNGSVKPLISTFHPKEYIGVDLEPGPLVDVVASADDLILKFGEETFDIVFCIEMLEHTPNWRESIRNMKRILKRGGLMLITTRSLGYPCHGFPHDHWRYEVEDLKKIFEDFEVQRLEKDYAEPGVFFKGRKPDSYQEKDLSLISLYNVNIGERTASCPLGTPSGSYYRRLRLKQAVKDISARLFLGCGRLVTKALNLR